ncbi:hypothetical protein EAI_12197 [Harpegnathos saltator]|uniref:Uncharacterized protein n=1 Tax=Harpegnathos saltator TaxID=610380 RepID=E2BXC5_HARSA|nr:hypothetical protein EAI_12197 [Harpegnathos saltator]
MRQCGSQHTHLRTASYGNGNANDLPVPPVLYAEPDPNLNQSAVDVSTKRCDKPNVNQVPISSDNDVATFEYLRSVNERRTRSESDCEPSSTFPGNSAGSSSNSSLSTRSLDSPSTSLEQVHPTTSATNASTSWDSDVDVEADPPDWSQAVAEDVLAHLSNSEKKRQEVINGE